MSVMAFLMLLASSGLTLPGKAKFEAKVSLGRDTRVPVAGVGLLSASEPVLIPSSSGAGLFKAASSELEIS